MTTYDCWNNIQVRDIKGFYEKEVEVDLTIYVMNSERKWKI